MSPANRNEMESAQQVDCEHFGDGMLANLASWIGSSPGTGAASTHLIDGIQKHDGFQIFESSAPSFHGSKNVQSETTRSDCSRFTSEQLRSLRTIVIFADALANGNGKLPTDYLESLVFNGKTFELLTPPLEFAQRKTMHSLGATRKSTIHLLIKTCARRTIQNLQLEFTPVQFSSQSDWIKIQTDDVSGTRSSNEREQLELRLRHPTSQPLLCHIDRQLVGGCCLHFESESEASGKTFDDPQQHPTFSSLFDKSNQGEAGKCASKSWSSILGIYDLKVVKKHRGKGFGKRILKHLEHFGLEHGFSLLGVFCLEELAAFYQSYGFESVGNLERWSNCP